MKFFTTGNLKSCFSIGNANFRCMKVWRSYHVVKLLWLSYHVTKLLATSLVSGRTRLPVHKLLRQTFSTYGPWPSSEVMGHQVGLESSTSTVTSEHLESALRFG